MMGINYKPDGLINADKFEIEFDKFGNALEETYNDEVDFNPFELCEDLQNFRSNMRIQCTDEQYGLFYPRMIIMMVQSFNEFLAKGTHGKDYNQIKQFFDSIYFDVNEINSIKITEQHQVSNPDTIHVYATIIYQFKKYNIIDVAAKYFYENCQNWLNYINQLNDSGIDIIGEYKKRKMNQNSENNEPSENKKIWLGILNEQKVKNQFYLIMLTFFELGIFDKAHGNLTYFIRGLSALLGENFEHCKKNAFELKNSDKSGHKKHFTLIEQVSKKYEELYNRDEDDQ